eukprot:TRINITY_DN2824_c0_g2_i1.p1 TRINITY_DN2824_c0_g2~~TRINITY_DN2824_c0_g2_i1.p1  ORF type:complete len:487 (+),score=79.88 TRINITY_DN2824_c0_g2_i1:96-1463(+)
MPRDRRPTTSMKIEDPLASPRMTSALQGRKVSVAVSVCNLLSTIIGSGVLSLAWVVQGVGQMWFVISMIIMGWLANLSVGMLVEAAELREKYTWMELATDTFGHEKAKYICILVITQCFGSVTSYLVIIKDLFTIFFPGYQYLLTTLLATFFMYPILRSKTILHMGVFSFLASCSILLFLVFIAVKYASAGVNPEAVLSGQPVEKGSFLSCIPVVCFSFTCHPAVLDVLKELKECDKLGRTKRVRGRMHMASTTAVISATFVYTAAGLIGYLRYKNGSLPNLLSAVGKYEADTVTTLLQVAVLASISLHVPLIAYPCRNLLKSLTPWLHPEIRMLSLIYVPLVFALLIPVITMVFSFTGVVASISLVFLLPPLLCQERKVPFGVEATSDETVALLGKSKDEEDVEMQPPPSPLGEYGGEVLEEEDPASYTTMPKRGLLFTCGGLLFILSVSGWIA